MNRYGKVINDRVNRDFLNTLIGFGTGAFISAFLVIVLMFSSKVEAYDANGEDSVSQKTFISKLVINL